MRREVEQLERAQLDTILSKVANIRGVVGRLNVTTKNGV